MFAYSLLALSLALGGCQGPRLLRDSNARVHVVIDSPIMDDLANRAVKSREDVMKRLASSEQQGASSSEDVATNGLALNQSVRLEREVADRMGKERGYDVPGQTAITILRESDALLYSKVRFEDGPFKGKVGWVSRALIDDPRTKMP